MIYYAKKCPPGTYRHVEDGTTPAFDTADYSDTCITCPRNFMCPRWGMEVAEACKAGEWANEGATICQPCDPGRDCGGVAFETDYSIVRVDLETVLDDRTFSVADLAITPSNYNVVDCPDGFHCFFILVDNGVSPFKYKYQIEECPLGSYCPRNAATKRTYVVPCPAGTVPTAAALWLESHCYDNNDARVEPGKYSAVPGQTTFPGDLIAAQASLCYPGYYCDEDNASNPMQKGCAAGTYND